MVKNKHLKILYHLPNPHSIYAGKTIYYGYKHAFEKLGHTFQALTPDTDQKIAFLKYKPDLFFTSIGPLIFKYLDLSILVKAKKIGTKVVVTTPFWNSPMSKLRINEVSSLKDNSDVIKLIKSGNFGDIYHNICEQGDPRMEGFEKTTGYKHHTILLAADNTLIYPDYSKKFEADISYIGTYLPGKKKILDEQVKPLMKKYRTKIYGQDWTPLDRILGLIQRGGQYLNIPYLRSFLKQPLQLEDERRVYNSSCISINIHEDYQKQFKGDINERTFKIPLARGFEVVDNVPSLKKYFKIDEELVVANNRDDWFDKIGYYLQNPSKRKKIIDAGEKRVMKEHTYQHRVKQIISILKNEK